MGKIRIRNGTQEEFKINLYDNLIGRYQNQTREKWETLFVSFDDQSKRLSMWDSLFSYCFHKKQRAH